MRTGARTVLLGVGLVLAAAAISRAATPPLYDGLGFPDEPYRFFPPVAGATTKPATAANATAAVPSSGQSPELTATSAEKGPQVVVFVAQAGLVVPSGGTSVRLSATPVAAPVTAPPDGKLYGDVYRLAATDQSGRPATVRSGSNLIVNLRSAKAVNTPVTIEMWSGNRWTQLRTSQVGNDIYAARLSRFADIAPVLLDATAAQKSASPGAATSGAAAPPAGGSGQHPTAWIAASSVLVVLLGLIGLVRVRRTRAATRDDSP